MSKEAMNHLLIGIATGIASRGTDRPAFFNVVEGEATTFSAFFQRGMNLVVSHDERGTQSVSTLSHFAAAKKLSPPGVVGPSPEADAFAKSWEKDRDCTSSFGMDQIIYSLAALKKRKTQKGKLRPAGPGDHELVSQWLWKFRSETLPHEPINPSTNLSQSITRIASQQIFLLDVKGETVALAGIAGRTPNGIRINSVYTPSSFRGEGYATSIVSQLCEKMFHEGLRYCFLYTDASAPIPNRLYRNLGFTEVCHSRHHLFHY